MSQNFLQYDISSFGIGDIVEIICPDNSVAKGKVIDLYRISTNRKQETYFTLAVDVLINYQDKPSIVMISSLGISLSDSVASMLVKHKKRTENDTSTAKI